MGRLTMHNCPCKISIEHHTLSNETANKWILIIEATKLQQMTYNVS